jgi:amino acid transporter
MSTLTYENDPEKGANGKSLGPSSSPELDAGVQMNVVKEPWSRRFVDSFKRDPNAHVTKPAQRADGKERGFDHQAAAERTANSGLAHKLKARHMQMIAIGGSIGEHRVMGHDVGWLF